MSDKKNQHYVPRCHLRPFCPGGGEAINLYNIAADKLIQNAPIKGQCSKNFFYGADGELETLLQQWEGHYASIVRKASNAPESIDQSEMSFLREFTLLQMFRTSSYAEKSKELSDRHHEDIKAGATAKTRLPPRMFDSLEQAVTNAIRLFVRSRDRVDDLDTCLIINETGHQFITSDDPAVQTNRYHFQRLQKKEFGLGSSGAMFFLPLTPKIAFVAFDGNVYKARFSDGNLIRTRDVREVSAINELQLLQAQQNIYSEDFSTGETIAAEFKRCKDRRPKAWNALRYFEKIPGTRIYEAVDRMSFTAEREFLAQSHQYHVCPSRWTGLLKPRLSPKVVDTGTGYGVLRPTSTVLNEVMQRTSRARPIFVSAKKRR